MALIATAGAANANAYCDVAFADAYLTGERLYIDAWTAATTPLKERALIWATFLLDTCFDWDGGRTYPATQALANPRSGMTLRDGIIVDYFTIHLIVKKATATLGLHLLEQDRTKEPTLLGLGFSDASLDGVGSITVDSTAKKKLIPDELITMLAPLATLDITGGGLGRATIKRV